MTSATDALRALLDEREVEHFDGCENTMWGYEQTSESTGIYRYSADEISDGFVIVRLHHLTPEQAVAATLGPTVPPPPPPEQPPYDLLIDLLRDEWGIEVSWDGLRKFWHVGCTDERVTAIGELHDELRDAIVEVLGNRCDWNQQGVAHAHEVIEKAATLGPGTCHPIISDNLNESEGTGDAWADCSECGHLLFVLTDPNSQPPNYCPNCGKRVVG